MFLAGVVTGTQRNSPVEWKVFFSDNADSFRKEVTSGSPKCFNKNTPLANSAENIALDERGQCAEGLTSISVRILYFSL